MPLLAFLANPTGIPGRSTFSVYLVTTTVDDRSVLESLCFAKAVGSGLARRDALQALAEKWPDETTRELLAQRAVEGPDLKRRREACSALGKMHSAFGRILLTKYLNGIAPYLDPLKPIPRDHIERAAERARIGPDDIDAQVASLSAHLGWDVTRGAEKKVGSGKGEE